MWHSVNKLWALVFFTLLHPMLKWVMRRLTGRCELLRITYMVYSGPLAGTRTFAVESSLKHSKTYALKRLLAEDNINIDAAIEDIMKIKSVSPEVHPRFGPTLKTCLCQICGYRQLISEVESVRKTPYSSENREHEKLLLQLWHMLMPDQRLQSRISKQWTDIGFQGEDPMTDFRGMGMLGLRNLLYFVSHYPEAAKQLLSHSQHPQYGYSFAIVGINITGLAVSLLTGGYLKTHFYNVVEGKPRLEHFHQVYCYLLYEFDKFWFAEKPRDIMEFNRVKQKFHKKLTNMLKDKNTVLDSSVCISDRTDTMRSVPSMHI